MRSKLLLQSLESRDVPAQWYTVSLDSPSQGVQGDSPLAVSGVGLSTSADVWADSPSGAVKIALTGQVTVGRQTYEFNPQTVSETAGYQRPFLLVQTATGYEVRLEDLAAEPQQTDWDYNDTTWNISIEPAAMNYGSRTPPVKPSGGTSSDRVPEGATKIGEPGRILYPRRSIAIVSDNSVEGDAQAIRRVSADDIRVFDRVGGGWEQVRGKIEKSSLGILGTFGSLIISGHGFGGGVSASDPTKNLSISLLLKDIDTIEMIKSRLAPGAPIIMAGCGCGNNPEALQALADATGHPVIANTGTMSDGNNGSGIWVRYDPKK